MRAMAKHQKLLIQLIFENNYISNCLPDLEDFLAWCSDMKVDINDGEDIYTK